jgi:hypothetical protein
MAPNIPSAGKGFNYLPGKGAGVSVRAVLVRGHRTTRALV